MRSGIGIDELAWVRRDQFVYYVTMARELHDPHRWPTFRLRLLEALEAAGGIAWIRVDRDLAGEQARTDRRRRQALGLLERVRAGYDPAVCWAGFFEALYDGWVSLSDAPD